MNIPWLCTIFRFFQWPLFVGRSSHSNFANNQKALCAILFHKLFLKMSHFHNTQAFEYEIALIRKASLCRKYKFLGNSSEGLKIGLSATQLKSDWVDSLKYICINLPRFAGQEQAVGWKGKKITNSMWKWQERGRTGNSKYKYQKIKDTNTFSWKSQIQCKSDKRGRHGNSNQTN